LGSPILHFSFSGKTALGFLAGPYSLGQKSSGPFPPSFSAVERTVRHTFLLGCPSWRNSVSKNSSLETFFMVLPKKVFFGERLGNFFCCLQELLLSPSHKQPFVNLFGTHPQNFTDSHLFLSFCSTIVDVSVFFFFLRRDFFHGSLWAVPRVCGRFVEPPQNPP